MGPDVPTLDAATLRRSDGNTLLRMYDQAKRIADQSPSPSQRARAGRATERLARELERRQIAP